MTEIAADRLYIGETLIWEKQTATSGIADFPAVPVLDWGVINGLGTSSSVSITYAQPAVSVSGYVPLAFTDFGNSNGYISARFTGSVAQQPAIVMRYRDQNNWIYWAPRAPRVRARIDGVNYDTPTVLVSSFSRLGAYMDGDTIWLLADDKVIDVVTEQRLQHETRHGFGSAAASGAHPFYDVRWDTETSHHRLSYPDVESLYLAIDNAVSIHELQGVLTPLAEQMGGAITLQDVPSSSPTTGNTGSFDITHPNIRTVCKKLLTFLGKVPIGGLQTGWHLYLAAGVTVGGQIVSGGTHGRTSWVNIEPTPAALDSVSSNVGTVLGHTIAHEIAHAMSSIYSSQTALMGDDFGAANPPGFSYGGDAVGGRPDGFCRGYGTTAFEEDQADVFAWLMEPDLRGEFEARAETDSVLAGKKLAMRKFLARIGWALDALDK